MAAGCGANTYEQRLELTARYFRSLALQNANLKATWTDAETTVSLRPPLKFEELPPPETRPAEEGPAEQPAASAPARPQQPDGDQQSSEEEEVEEGTEKPRAASEPEEEEIPDPRQPDYLPDLRLPGLRGAFRAELKVIDEDNNVAEGRGYLYVLTNHHLAGNEERARAFHDDLVKLLGEALNMRARPDDLRDETFPKRQDAFMKTTRYRALELVPEEPIGSLARPRCSACTCTNSRRCKWRCCSCFPEMPTPRRASPCAFRCASRPCAWPMATC